MKWFLNLLERLGRKRIVLDRQSNEPYLERYYLFLRDRQRFPFNIFYLFIILLRMQEIFRGYLF